MGDLGELTDTFVKVGLDGEYQALTEDEFNTLRTALEIHEEALKETHDQTVDAEPRLKSWEELLETAGSIKSQIEDVHSIQAKLGLKGGETNGDGH